MHNDGKDMMQRHDVIPAFFNSQPHKSVAEVLQGYLGPDSDMTAMVIDFNRDREHPRKAARRDQACTVLECRQNPRHLECEVKR